jgi:hypothetical protein
MSSEPLEVYHHGHMITHSAVNIVDLSWNHFVKLPQSLTWQLFENLTHLTLSHNRIEELPSSTSHTSHSRCPLSWSCAQYMCV